MISADDPRPPGEDLEPGWRPEESWTGLLVERENVLARIADGIDGLMRGRCSVLHLTAPPGGGLTAVLDRAARMAGEHGAGVVRGRCPIEEPITPFLLTTQVVASMGADVDSLVHPRSDDTPLAAEMVVRLCRVVLDEAGRRPLVLLVDDAQWIDPFSRQWLSALVRRAHHLPLLVVIATARLGGSAQMVVEFDVPNSVGAFWTKVLPLTAAGLSRALAAAHPGPVDQDFVAALVEHTGGIPLVVRHVLAVFAAERRAPSAAEAPRVRDLAHDGVRDQVDRRIQAVPATARLLLNAMAVCHGTFDVPQSATVAALDAATCSTQIDILATAGLVVARDDPRLPSGMVVERVLASMAADERKLLHAEAARLAYHSAIADEVVARLLIGAPPMCTPWAAVTLRRAAASSRTAGEHRLAVDYLDRALREPLTGPERARLLVECGTVEVRLSPGAGDWRLAQVLSAEGGDELTADRLAAADLLLARGNCTLVRRVLASVHARRDIGAAERDTVCALYWSADEAPHEEPELDPHVIPRLPSDPVGAAQSGVAAWAAVAKGEDIEAARRLARAAIDEPIGRDSLLFPRLAAARALMLTDDTAESVMAFDAVVLEARRRHAFAMAGWALLMRARIAARQGFLDAAAADLEGALDELPLHCWHPTVRPAFIGLDLVLALESGRFDDAERIASSVAPSAADDGFSYTHLLFAKGVLKLYTGDPAGALGVFDECGRRLLARGWGNPALLAWRTFAALARVACGSREEAVRQVLEEVRLAERWNAPSTTGGAHLGAGMVLEGPEALVHKERAVAVLRHSSSRLRYASALVELARAKEEGSAEARSLIAEAERMAAVHGAVGLSGRVRPPMMTTGQSTADN